jgi:hypothetical protein
LKEIREKPRRYLLDNVSGRISSQSKYLEEEAYVMLSSSRKKTVVIVKVQWVISILIAVITVSHPSAKGSEEYTAISWISY